MGVMREKQHQVEILNQRYWVVCCKTSLIWHNKTKTAVYTNCSSLNKCNSTLKFWNELIMSSRAKWNHWVQKSSHVILWTTPKPNKPIQFTYSTTCHLSLYFPRFIELVTREVCNKCLMRGNMTDILSQKAL